MLMSIIMSIFGIILCVDGAMKGAIAIHEIGLGIMFIVIALHTDIRPRIKRYFRKKVLKEAEAERNVIGFTVI